mgnify:CR=1 FL=1
MQRKKIDNVYPFTAIVGQEKMKEAIVLNLINPALGGVLIRGQKGTAKTTVVRAIPNLMHKLKIVEIPANATDEDVFTVRAANQMGGLGQASNGSNATGIDQSTVNKEVVERQYYNVNGIRINNTEKGLNIIRTIYSDGTIDTVKEFVK